MTNLFVMVGVPGSGKSTKAVELSNRYNAKIFSSDAYREKLLGSEEDQTNNQLVFNTLYSDMKQYLSDGRNAIIDATNITCKCRRTLLNNFKHIENCNRIAYVVNTPISECIKRDSERERTVGENVIWKFVRQFEFPVLNEGFNTIMLDNEKGYLIPYQEFEDAPNKTINFNQNNHHHTMTLDKHVQAVMNNYDISDYCYWAAKYHDVGKVYTESKDENGESHYYNHANVSAYWLTSHINVIPDGVFSRRFDIIRLVNYHMRAYDIFKSEKSILKYTRLLGNEFMEALKNFNDNDMNAK